jgi:hypothetical protein
VSRRLIVPLLAALAVLAVPASASAKVNVVVGIGDQNQAMFASPYWQQLALKRTRYFIPWDAIGRPAEIAKFDAFLAAAKARNVKVLLHLSSNDLRRKKGTLPSANKYKSKVKQLVARYRAMGVTDWGVWNEANHDSQETYKNPKRAAEFYKKFRQIKCKSCKVVALDVLDQAGVTSYIKRWLKAAGSAGRKAKVFGIHNYSEVNRLLNHGSTRFPGTRRIIDAVRKKNKKAHYWYTETGALTRFGSFGCSQTRPVKTLKHMFTLAKRFDKYVDRLYTYNWTGADCQIRFDAGLVNTNGSPRPVYFTFKSKLAGFKK